MSHRSFLGSTIVLGGGGGGGDSVAKLHSSSYVVYSKVFGLG